MAIIFLKIIYKHPKPILKMKQTNKNPTKHEEENILNHLNFIKINTQKILYHRVKN